LTIPLFAFFTVLTVLVLAAALRRLMGITLSPLRTVIAALIALFSASPIITAMAGAAVSRKHPGILPGLWFVFLGVVIAMLVGMIFLVISEALVPSGSLPGPLYVLRGARRMARRARRYSQIIRRNTAADELAALTPMLRRLPRRIDRIGGALEDGRLTVSVRLLADPSDRRYLTGLLHRVLLAFLAAATGIMAVLMIGIHGGPALSKTVSLYSFFGYCLLVIAAILAVRVLVQVFRPDPE
jgi:hypothetical protein